jgi:hypothetical protein
MGSMLVAGGFWINKTDVFCHFDRNTGFSAHDETAVLLLHSSRFALLFPVACCALPPLRSLCVGVVLLFLLLNNKYKHSHTHTHTNKPTDKSKKLSV